MGWVYTYIDYEVFDSDRIQVEINILYPLNALNT